MYVHTHAYENPNTMEFLKNVVMARGINKPKSFNSKVIFLFT